MESFVLMLRQQTMLLVFMLAGVCMKKRSIVSAEGQRCFTEFLVRVALPCMVFSSFDPKTSAEVLRQALPILFVSFLLCLIGVLAGFVLYRKMLPERRSVMQYGTMVSNAGFAGLPQVRSMFGPEGLLYGSMYSIPLRVFMWSVGLSFFMHTDTRTKMKKILLNPSMIAVYIGIPRMLLHIPLPEGITGAIGAIGDCSTPMSMIVIGMVVADIPLRTVINRGALVLTFIRLLVIPLTLLFVLKQFSSDPLLLGVSVVLASMPVPANTPILAQKYGGDYQYASKAVLLSTVLSLLTLPLISLLL